MKKLIAFLLVIVVAQEPSEAQRFSSNLVSKVSASILQKIFTNYTSRISLSDKSQLWLAGNYLKNDSIVLAYVQSKRPPEEIQILSDSLNLAIEKDVPAFFTKDELIEFRSKIVDKRKYAAPIINNVIYPRLDMNTPLGYALTRSEDMRLRATQTDSLISYLTICKSKATFAEQNPDSGFFDKDAFQSDALAKILTQKQHAALLSVMHADDARRDAKYAWHDLVAYNLSEKLNKESTIKELTGYFLSQMVTSDLIAYDRGKQRMAMQMLKAPACLQKLNEARMSNEMKIEKYKQ